MKQAPPRLGLPAPADYWAHPPRQGKGDDDPDRLYLAVGKSLSEWENVELVMSMFFGLLVAGDSKGHAAYIAMRAYGQLASAKGRADLLSEASKAFFLYRRSEVDDKKDFEALHNHFCRAGEIRNCIAHGTATNWFFNDKPAGYFLEPPNYGSKKTDHSTQEPFPGQALTTTKVAYRYTSQDVDGQGEKFTKLKEVALELLKNLRQKYGPDWSS